MLWALAVLAFYVLVFAGILALRRLARADIAEWSGTAGRNESPAAAPPVPPSSC